MKDIIGLALGPVVSCSAPASRPLASSVNISLHKFSADRIQLPIILDFDSDKGREDIKNWYRRQPTTRFTYIEYRKDRDGPFRHEFVAAYLNNATICRFDRRAREGMRGHALKDEGTISEDSAHIITSVDTQSRTHLENSDVLLKVELPEGQDIKFVLAVCYAIQFHPRAKSYSLLHYNCYFFSWTLVATLARRAYNWEANTKPIYLWESVEFRLLEYIGAIRDGQKLRVRTSSRLSLGARIRPQVLPVSNEPGHSSGGPRSPKSHPRGPGLVGNIFVKRSRHNSEAYSDISTVEGKVYGRIEQELRDYYPDMPPNTVEMLLLKSQMSPVLMREVSSVFSRAKAISASDMDLGFWSPSKKRARMEEQKTMTRVCDLLTDRIERDIQAVISVDLPDPVFIQPKLEPKEIEADITPDESLENSLETEDNVTEPITHSLQEYVKERMEVHFEQVETYGFGRAEELIDRVEKSMTEIWASVVDMTRHEALLPFLV
ncbi:unnamed protein product [Rhizoctonia solani]|uniref:Uncharacterized protein n=1 Tax=Rhizoctonia solani TaxID=456999 RepID=A0A8H3AG58_9AGAM|nr:unnamed protein product [Rhizoctonia solani]